MYMMACITDLGTFSTSLFNYRHNNAICNTNCNKLLLGGRQAKEDVGNHSVCRCVSAESLPPGRARPKVMDGHRMA